MPRSFTTTYLLNHNNGRANLSPPFVAVIPFVKTGLIGPEFQPACFRY